MNKLDIFYSFFDSAIPCRAPVELYDTCIDLSNSNGVALDIGADLCEGLTQSLLDKKWDGKIIASDLWSIREPSKVESITYIKGDAPVVMREFLSTTLDPINIVEIDLRSIYSELYKDDQRLDFEMSKTGDVLDSCINNLVEGSIIIIKEFHTHSASCSYLFHVDAKSLSKFLSKLNFDYKCIAYGKNFPMSAWQLYPIGTQLHGNDLENLITLLT
jgi:hypothetical protein